MADQRGPRRSIDTKNIVFCRVERCSKLDRKGGADGFYPRAAQRRRTSEFWARIRNPAADAGQGGLQLLRPRRTAARLP